MSRCRSESGQSVVLAVVFLTVLMGMAALVVDVGSWYKAQRDAQVAADAAALAGAQALPEDSASAKALAADYAVKNGGGLTKSDVTASVVPGDTIEVEVHREAPGFFAKIFGIKKTGIAAKASARAANPAEAKWVAPVVVHHLHPDLHSFGKPTTIELADLHKPGGGDAAGAFGLIKLLRDGNGSVGADELAEWVERGFDQYMPLGKYYSVPSSMFNSSQFRNAMDFRMGDDLLFPIYRTILKSGSNAEYDVIGWVGFHVTGRKGGGDTGTLEGWFTRIITEGISSEKAGDPDYGVRVVSLVE
jgi:hypothetical protein